MSAFAQKFRISDMSLRLRLGIGAAALGMGTCLIAAIVWLGMGQVADRLDAALAAENRIARYAALSQQAASFLIVATEAVQTGRPTAIRMQRIAPVADQLAGTFAELRRDVQAAVAAAETLGLDEQSRYGTQSLGLARMEAMLEVTLAGLAQDTDDTAQLRAQIDQFAANFDPLLSQAISTEGVFKTAILVGIADLRLRLVRLAALIAALTVAAFGVFYFGLILPQFQRLERLRCAAQQIGQADFAVALPTHSDDEIGKLYFETNRMAVALQLREEAVEREAARLNQTIADRTEALRGANARLAQIDQNRRRFFADISHELRTPLTVILMEAQLGPSEPGAAQDAFAKIEARAERLSRRIDDLLRVARSETGQLALDPQEVSLQGLITAVAEEVGTEVKTAQMCLSLVNFHDISISCDPNWMRQVLVSLVRNALRYARQGGQIGITLRQRDKQVAIDVIDNGPGVSAADQERVFTRFAQGGDAKAEGFGVGLPLARWVAEAHGGTVTLTSPLPRAEALRDAPGTRVTVTLPISKK
ncbi:ATP-binding protein [Loktanella agnita]|uniref:sensor histidine kinase n=1 Tax=Loktanella agnita TaxID=287097 RepID=UPI0039883E3B